MKKQCVIFNIVVFLLFEIGGCNKTEDCKKALTWNEHIQQKCLIEMKKFLKDPDSYQSISWKVVDNYPKYIALKNRMPEWDGEFYKWTFIHELRAKNSFGGYNVQTVYFLIDSLENVDIREEGGLPSYVK